MWQEEYLESLTPLPEALNEVGFPTEVVSVSLAPNDTEKWDHPFAVSIIGGVPTMLDILQDTGFFFVLGQFSNIFHGLQAAGLLPTVGHWKLPASGGGVLQTFTPFFRMLNHLNPWEVFHGFWSLRDFLAEVEGEDWEGQECVRYMAAVQQGLEDLQPRKILNWFEGLRDFLDYQHPYLPWLASHPEVHKELGPLNFFPMLMLARKVMAFGMEYYHACLTDLHEVLVDLGKVEAIVASPNELDMY